MICGYFILTVFVLLVDGEFGDRDEVKSVSVVKGDAVTLQTGLNKEQYEVISWYFNDIQIAEYDRDIDAICLYDGVDGIFRNKLKVDYETGSLTITNTTTEHTGRYEAEIIRRRPVQNLYPGCFSTDIIEKILNIADSTETFTVTVNDYNKTLEKTSAMNPGQSSAAAAGSLLVLVLLCWWLQLLV